MTYCQDCRHALIPFKDAPGYRWLCRQQKRMAGDGFVTRIEWEGAEPFMRCSAINGGACPMFEAKEKQK